MPSISVSKERLCQLLGREYSTEQLSETLFDFGVELDDAYEENGKLMYKLDIGANRYDLLCVEGLAYALRSYMFGEVYNKVYDPSCLPASNLTLLKYSTDERHEVACAVIRDVDMTGEAYESFINYQDKLHSSIGRNRSIVSIGTHDLSKIQGGSNEIVYKSINLKDVLFTPLNSSKTISGDKLKNHLSTDKKLSKYFNLLKNQDRSVVFMKDELVLSIPPIINSNESKISQETKDIFIEVTGTNFKKVNSALKMLIYNFAGEKVETVRIRDVESGEESVTPVFDRIMFKLRMKTVRERLNLKMTRETVKELLEKMEYLVRMDRSDEDCVIVEVVDVRSDVMHECDIIEDIAIAYGFNNFKKECTEIYSVGREEPLTRFVDKLRLECAMCGFNETLTLTLLSENENFVESAKQVVLENPKSKECEVVRTSLLPGLLKTVAVNQHVRIPIRLFEIADVVQLDESADEGAVNKKRLCGVIAGNTSMLEAVHGPLSMIFEKCNLKKYKYENSDTEYFLQNQAAAVFIGDKQVGKMGVVHPHICKSFNISYAVSAFEIDIDEVFSEFTKNNQ